MHTMDQTLLSARIERFSKCQPPSCSELGEATVQKACARWSVALRQSSPCAGQAKRDTAQLQQAIAAALAPRTQSGEHAEGGSLSRSGGAARAWGKRR